uniref:Polyprotein n=1 Tax=Macrophomina phaseolina poty-like virus TaxID=2741658 RepID=A0A7U3VDC0_9POTY|nr:polyprotein [Macrophomina phaseolina poty-like virus]
MNPVVEIFSRSGTSSMKTFGKHRTVKSLGEGYCYLYLFHRKFHAHLAEKLGPDPSIHIVKQQEGMLSGGSLLQRRVSRVARHWFHVSVQEKPSARDEMQWLCQADKVVSLSPCGRVGATIAPENGDDSVTVFMETARAFANLKDIPSNAHRLVPETEGYCYLNLFFPGCRVFFGSLFGPWPSVDLLARVPLGFRTEFRGMFEQAHDSLGHSVKYHHHLVSNNTADNLWIQIDRIVAERSLAFVGGSVCSSEDDLTDYDEPASEVPAYGYCYIRLLKKEFRDEACLRLGPWPSIFDVLTIPEEHWLSDARFVGLASQGPNMMHITRVQNPTMVDRPILRDMCLQMAARHPSLKLGGVGLVPKELYSDECLLLVSLACQTLFTENPILFMLFVTSLLILAIVISPFMTQRIIYREFGPASATLIRSLPPVVSHSVTACALVVSARPKLVIWVLISGLMEMVLLLQSWMVFVSTLFSWRDSTLRACERAYVGMFTYLNSIAHSRQQQAGPSITEKWANALLGMLSNVCSILSLISQNYQMSQVFRKLSMILSKLASNTGTPRVLKEFLDTCNHLNLDCYNSHGVHEPIVEMPIPEPLGLHKDPPLDKDGRTFQASNFAGVQLCSHLTTKTNVLDIGNTLARCGRGSIHMITAATGTGKSTVIPYMMANRTGKIVCVSIPTIAAVRSSSAVIKARFGVTVHQHAEGNYRAGDSNIHIFTGRALMAKLVHNPQYIDSIGVFIFDEMHVNDAENRAFRILSTKLASSHTVIWASATFAQSFTLPGDLSHPVEERIDKTITRNNIFSTRCKVPGLTPKTIAGRYLVFCASVRDCKYVTQKFEGDWVRTFVVHSKNLDKMYDKMNSALGDPSINTVIIAATPCLETGFTGKINYVVDLREMIVPQVTFDPLAISTKRVPVSKGSATQRKGRVGRLFAGVYCAPPVRFSPDEELSHSSYGMDWVYAQLFGYNPKLTHEIPRIHRLRLTDTMIGNIFSAKVDPLCLMGMSSDDGSIFNGFRGFSYPEGVDKNRLVYSEYSMPVGLWRSWGQYETRPVKVDQGGARGAKVISSVRAPFFDYTEDEETQVANWFAKTTTDGRVQEIDDPRLVNERYKKYDIMDKLQMSRLYMNNREFQNQPIPECPPPPVETEEERHQREAAHHFAHNVKYGASVPLWSPRDAFCEEPSFAIPFTILLAFWKRRPFLLCVIVISMFLLFIKYACQKWFSREHELCDRPEEGLVVSHTDDVAMAKKRPFEGRKRQFLPSDISLNPDDFVDLDFGDGRARRRIRLQELDEEIDRYFGDSDRPVDSWAEDCVNVSGVSARGDSFSYDLYENRVVAKREPESKLHVKEPTYPLAACIHSVFSVHRKSDGEFIAKATVVGNHIIMNTHVLKLATNTFELRGLRGRFDVKPRVIFQERDLTIALIPTGMPGTSRNLSVRVPIPGEEVCLIRVDYSSSDGFVATPSVISYAVAAHDGLYGYSISTAGGDCGTPVISVADGSLVGIHSLGGNLVDEQNFFLPITEIVMKETLRRRLQNNCNGMLTLPNFDESRFLHSACAVAREEQEKKPITELDRSGVTRVPLHGDCSFQPLATMRKHVVKKSKITIDPFSTRFFASFGTHDVSQITDYRCSELSNEAYWKDLTKYRRSVSDVPVELFEVAERFFRRNAQWMFEISEIPHPDEVPATLDRTKSSGPRLQHNKGHYLDGLDTHGLRVLVKACEMIYDCDPGVFSPPTWQVAIKDELRDRDRVVAHKTRTFMSCPIETMIGTFRVCRAYNDNFIDKHLTFPSTLGINKFRGGWHRLVGFLGGPDRHFSSGDGSRFDSSVGPAFAQFCCFLRQQSLPTRYHRILKNAYSEFVYTPLVTQDHRVWMKTQGNPSGSPNTSEDNTVTLISVMVYACCQLLGVDQFFAEYDACQLRFVCNGDDIMYAVSDQLKDIVNPQALREQFLTCGFDYTFTNPTTDITEVVYLSHSFFPCKVAKQTVYIPRLSTARIVASCVFQRRTDSISRQSKYVSALIHAFPHKNLYRHLWRLVLSHARCAGVDRPMTLESYSSQIFVPLPGDIVELYLGVHVGSIDKLKTHKDPSLLLERTYQSKMSHLQEHERGDADKATTKPQTVIGEPGEPATELNIAQLGSTSHVTKSRNPVTEFESTVNEIFNNTLTKRPRQRYIIAKSTQRQVEQTVANIRDKLGIDNADDMERVMVDMMVYYMDNSTSERNPSTDPYIHGGQEYQWQEIASWYVPTPRKFYRAVAEVLHQWLEMNPDFFPHWGYMHGFPRKYRSYAFDTADFCQKTPEEALKAIQAAKDVALSSSAYNLMRPDLKAVGSGGGTIVEQMAGSQFTKRMAGGSQYS